METEAFKFECPKCCQRLSVRERYVGQTLECPTCKAKIIVPDPNVPPPFVPPAPDEPPRLPKPETGELFTIWLDDKNAGPYTLGQLRSMWASGKITAKTRYWKHGSKQWRRLLDIASQLE